MPASITLEPVPSETTQAPPGKYTRGEQVQIEFTVKDIDGVPTEPADLTFTVRSPDGVDTEYVMGSDAEIVNNADGTGYLLLTLDQSARWLFRCVTDTPTGAAEVDAMVERSALEDPVIPVPGTPGAAYEGALARAASGVYSPYLATEEGETLTAEETNGVFFWVKRRGWIHCAVDTSGVTSATAEIAAKLAIAEARPGSCVYVPEGIIRLDANGLIIPEGVTFTGPEIGHHAGPFTFDNTIAAAGCSGATFYVYNTTGVTFTIKQQSRILNVLGYYPNQALDATPTAYDYFIQAIANAHNTTIANVTGINPYRFIRIGQATTPYAANGCRIDNVYGYPLSIGIVLGRCADVARVSNVHFNPGLHFDFGSTLKAWVQANGQAHVIDGPEEFAYSSCFVYGYNRGIRFVDADGDGFRGVNGSWVGGGLDICNACILVDQPNGLTLRGLKLSSVGLVPNGSLAYGVLYSDTSAAANADERPTIYATDVSFWNTMSRAVYLVSGTYGIYKQNGGSVRGHQNEAFRAEGSTARIMLSQVAVDGGTRTAAASSATVVDTDGYDP